MDRGLGKLKDLAFEAALRVHRSVVHGRTTVFFRAALPCAVQRRGVGRVAVEAEEDSCKVSFSKQMTTDFEETHHAYWSQLNSS